MNRTRPHREDSAESTPFTSAVSARVCAVMLILYALYYARSLAVPVVTTFVAYMVLRPLVRQGTRLRLHPTVSAAAIIGVLLVVFGFATYLIIEPAQQTIAEAPSHVTVVKDKLSFLTDKLREVNKAKEDLAETEDEAKESERGEKEKEPVPVETAL